LASNSVESNSAVNGVFRIYPFNIYCKENFMAQPLRITTPFPSLDETARKAGVPPARAREIVDLAQKIAIGTGKAAGPILVRKASKKSRVKSVAKKSGRHS
jgi:hypothetical protein